jgi:hypothetical protein
VAGRSEAIDLSTMKPLARGFAVSGLRDAGLDAIHVLQFIQKERAC